MEDAHRCADFSITCSSDQGSAQVTGQVILDYCSRDFFFLPRALGQWLGLPRIKLEEMRQLAISGHLHSDRFQVLRSSGTLRSGFYQIPEGTGLPLRPLSGASFPCIPTSPSSPPARSRGAFPHSSALPRRDRDTNSSESHSES